MPDEKTTEMATFFDERAGGYEHHMRRSIPGIERLYRRVAQEIAPGPDPVTVLDLGCGTGLELQPLFRRIPNAQITGVDLSAGMLSLLRKRYRKRAHQLRLIQGSYEEIPLEEGIYDCAISVMSLHHFEFERKAAIYERIRRSLRPGGVYIEGDYVVSPVQSREMLRRFRLLTGDSPEKALYHIDIPFSALEQLRVLEHAGFKDVDLVWKEETRAIFAARA